MRVQRREVDFDYIFSHFDQTKYEIPYYYDREVWKIGETYRMRVGHVYDPTKFWIVLKERELDIMQAFLMDFYTENGEQGLIVNIPHSSTVDKKAWVYLIDFGYIAVILMDNLYYLYEKLYGVPQFAVRASLGHVRPYRKPNWDYNAMRRFNELVSGKVLLCILECTDPVRKIVHITIGNVNDTSSVSDIGHILINEKLARSIAKRSSPEKESRNNSRYVPKTKYPYLFPSFEAIESGMVPSCVYTSELLRQCIATDVLFKPYFAYGGIKN
ncbi:hypothetical protein NQ314_004109 [Rhamnusium bicolor]|uniref:Tudor domain-containing protein n=1 Tax=Rhamnusium bicolor TaxID=1586634 RepID=A0AAV8ZLE4_9CUCU|nr:hypothetical protein NQ314_004109 [Rhamnusium bicolor]